MSQRQTRFVVECTVRRFLDASSPSHCAAVYVYGGNSTPGMVHFTDWLETEGDARRAALEWIAQLRGAPIHHNDLVHEDPPMDRAAYLGRFETTAEAIEFECQALSIGYEFLPHSARQVRDGQEPTAAYWTWLCDQVDRANGEG